MPVAVKKYRESPGQYTFEFTIQHSSEGKIVKNKLLKKLKFFHSFTIFLLLFTSFSSFRLFIILESQLAPRLPTLSKIFADFLQRLLFPSARTYTQPSRAAKKKVGRRGNVINKKKTKQNPPGV